MVGFGHGALNNWKNWLFFEIQIGANGFSISIGPLWLDFWPEGRKFN
jgi:hypothetical protein